MPGPNNKNFKREDFQTVDLGKSMVQNQMNFEQGLYSFCAQRLEVFKLGRRRREDLWLECWAQYLGTPEARERIKSRMLRHVGNVNNDWRHNMTTGKSFELVETIVSYLQGAFFPNRDWFDVIPETPGLQEDAEVIKSFAKKKLTEAAFMSHWELFLRQLAIVGSSVIALPWRYETRKSKVRVKVHTRDDPRGFFYSNKEEERVIFNNHSFEVLDVFDFYVDPIGVHPNHSDCIRRVIKTKAEIAQLIRDKYYKNLTVDQIKELPDYEPGDESTANKTEKNRYLGMETNIDNVWQNKVEIYELWGDVIVNNVCYKDTVTTWANDKILRFENNPFWYGKPFVVGTYTPVVRSTAALGVLEPSLGMIHELDIITNQRLDNLELSVDTMWEHVDDGTLTADDIFTEPGKVFTVSQQNTIQAIQIPTNFNITYEESALLEQRIDKLAGTGNLISANTARSAERVTAAEVQATRDAGGNRLSNVHKHVEATALLPLLDKLFKSYKQFVRDDELVRVPGQAPGDFDFVMVGEEEFSNDFKFMPVGADHIANKEFEVNQRLTFLQIVSQNPEMAQSINFRNFMIDIARRMQIDDIDQFINAPAQEAPAANPEELQPSSMREALAKEMGALDANSVAAQFQADGGAGMLQNMLGVNQAVPELPDTQLQAPQI